MSRYVIDWPLIMIMRLDDIDGYRKRVAKEDLPLACNKGAVKIAKLLLSLPNINVNSHDQYGVSALVHASNTPEIFRILLSHPDIDINNISKHVKGNIMYSKTYNGNTLRYLLMPTLAPLTDRHIESLAMLLQHPDVNINYLDRGKISPLKFAIYAANINAVKLLLQHPKINIEI